MDEDDKKFLIEIYSYMAILFSIFVIINWGLKWMK
jgi:hypothetical protein